MSIRINLLEDVGQEKQSPRHIELTLAGGAIAISAMLIWYLYAGQSSLASETALELANMETELEAMRKHNAEIVQLEKDKAELEKKIHVVQRLTSPQRRAASVRILDDLSLNTPEFLWLTEFAEKAGSVKINGKAIDNQTVASFAHNLAQSPYFENIEIRETVQEESDSQRAGAPVALTRFLIESGVNYFRGSLEGVRADPKKLRKGKGGSVDLSGAADLNMPDAEKMSRFGTEEMTEEKAAELEKFLLDAGMVPSR